MKGWWRAHHGCDVIYSLPLCGTQTAVDLNQPLPEITAYIGISTESDSISCYRFKDDSQNYTMSLNCLKNNHSGCLFFFCPKSNMSAFSKTPCPCSQPLIPIFSLFYITPPVARITNIQYIHILYIYLIYVTPKLLVEWITATVSMKTYLLLDHYTCTMNYQINVVNPRNPCC